MRKLNWQINWITNLFWYVILSAFHLIHFYAHHLRVIDRASAQILKIREKLTVIKSNKITGKNQTFKKYNQIWNQKILQSQFC